MYLGTYIVSLKPFAKQIKQIKMGGPPLVDGKYIEEFGNFYVCSFVMNNVVFTSVEQCFQYHKVGCDTECDAEYKQKILGAKTPKECWKIGRSLKNLRSDWEDIKVQIMYQANLSKFSQNEDLKDLLIKTFPYPIIFQEYNGDFWDNTNRQILEEIRDLLSC
jgi:ribA/ribD-fused uncharacterized protein